MKPVSAITVTRTDAPVGTWDSVTLTKLENGDFLITRTVQN